jgi:hypothetical protein
MKLTWHDFKYDGNSSNTRISKIRKNLASDDAVSSLDDDRAVYVIRLLPPFSLAYPLQPSPVMYIGRGKVWNRLSQGHTKWMSRIHQKLGVKFDVHFCSPRQKKYERAFKNVEADLIQMFVKKFGTLPLMNSRKEWPKKKWTYSKWSSRVPLRGIDSEYLCSLSLFDALFELDEA